MLKSNVLIATLLAAILSLCSISEVSAFSNPLVFGNNRITLITPTLFRVEYALQGKFVDQQTMFAYDRNNVLKDFTVTELGDNRYEIKTSAARIVYHNDGFPCGSMNFEVYFNHKGVEKKVKGRGNPHQNLGGAISTLDRVGGTVQTDEGLLSREGWYVIDDSGKDLIVDGEIVARDASHMLDQYYFAYGLDYKAAFASLGVISGKVPMTRKYMHGIWYCRYWSYTSQEFLDIIKGYNEHDFPIDNLVFDIGWHTQDNATTGTGDAGTRGWTGYTWNEKYIPNPDSLIRKVHESNLTVSLNDHPHDGLRSHDATYGDFLSAIRRENPSLIANDSVVAFNLSDPVYMKNFFKYAHGPSNKMNIDFWWLDWQQNYLYPMVHGTKTSSLSWINKLYYDQSLRDGKRGASYSRWAGWGDHRYPIQFSGDAFTSWDVLDFEVKLTSTSSNVGCYYWAHDIGGFYGSPKPELYPELYARWSQFGALSASLKVHSMKDPKLDRRPWIWGEMAENSARKAYHLRSEIFPYIYSCIWQTHSTMVPLIRSMYIDYGADDNSYKNAQEYMFGDLMLVAPITKPGEGEQKIASQRVWFPEGCKWYDWFSAEVHNGGETLDVSKTIDEFPLFVKGGHLLPMQPYTPRPATAPLSCLVLRCYPGADGADSHFALYEDDGVSEEFKNGGYATTDLQYSRTGDCVTIKVAAAKGEYTGQLKSRTYRIEMAATESVGKVKVGRKVLKPARDEAIKGYVIEIPETAITQDVVVVVEQVKD